MGCVGEAWNKCLMFKCCQVLLLLACSFQVNYTAPPTSQCRAIFSLTGVVRLATALWAQGITLSRASSPALG